MIKSNIPYYEEKKVILAMGVKDGAGTSFCIELTGREIDELETFIEKLISKHTKEQNEWTLR